MDGASVSTEQGIHVVLCSRADNVQKWYITVTGYPFIGVPKYRFWTCNHKPRTVSCPRTFAVRLQHVCCTSFLAIPSLSLFVHNGRLPNSPFFARFITETTTHAYDFLRVTGF